jgi:hypothetical protein
MSEPTDSLPPDSLMESSANALLSESEQAKAIQIGFRKARTKFGLARLELGSFLHTMRMSKLYLGEAENWEAFLAAENLNPHAARQYMTVAKKFIFELNVSEEMLGKLALAGITALEKAAPVINQENQEELLSALIGLGEKDAIQRLIELSSGDEPKPEKATMRVITLLREYHNMPPDLQREFRLKIERNDSDRGRTFSQISPEQKAVPKIAPPARGKGFFKSGAD